MPCYSRNELVGLTVGQPRSTGIGVEFANPRSYGSGAVLVQVRNDISPTGFRAETASITVVASVSSLNKIIFVCSLVLGHGFDRSHVVAIKRCTYNNLADGHAGLVPVGDTLNNACFYTSKALNHWSIWASC